MKIYGYFFSKFTGIILKIHPYLYRKYCLTKFTTIYAQNIPVCLLNFYRDFYSKYIDTSTKNLLDFILKFTSISTKNGIYFQNSLAVFSNINGISAHNLQFTDIYSQNLPVFFSKFTNIFSQYVRKFLLKIYRYPYQNLSIYILKKYRNTCVLKIYQNSSQILPGFLFKIYRHIFSNFTLSFSPICLLKIYRYIFSKYTFGLRILYRHFCSKCTRVSSQSNKILSLFLLKMLFTAKFKAILFKMWGYIFSKYVGVV